MHFNPIRAVCTAAALSVAGMPAIAEELRGWNIHPEDYPISQGLIEFAAVVEDQTGDEITTRIFHNGVLGDQPDAIEQLRLGAIDFAVFNLGPMGQVVPEANVVSLPFIFKSIDQMYRLMDGEVGDAIAAGMEQKDIVALAWYDSGARSFYNSIKPITAPADVQGMKVRVMNNDLFVDMIASMGGNATPMAFGEVYQSLSTGVVDGAENNPPSYESTAHFEVAKYYSMTEHLIIPECLCVSKMTWDGLAPEVQQIMRDAALASAETERQLWQERQAQSMEAVAAAGSEINEIADKAAFQQAMAPVYDKFLSANPELADLVETMRSAD